MQPRLPLALGASLLLAGCALLGFGPETSVIDGWVYSAERQEPLPRAEVCAFGVDTVCVRADRQGHYRVRLGAQTLVLRFRFGSLPPAMSDTVHVIPPAPLTVNCALTSRLVVTDHALPCQPVAGR